MKPNKEEHKERLRKRYAESGFKGFHDYEILELALSYCQPHKDTNAQAKCLTKLLVSVAVIFNAYKNGYVEVKTSDYALDTAKERISYAINGITKADFRRDARQNKTCNQCDWKDLYPKRKGFRYN